MTIALPELDTVQKLFQLAVLFVGCIGAYLKWFHGRLFKPRLELTVSGKVIERGFVHATIRIKNVGSIKCDLQPDKGAGLRLLQVIEFPAVPDGKAVDPSWQPMGVVEIFPDHGFLESMETVEEQHLFQVGGALSRFYKLEFRVASRGMVWKAISIFSESPSKSV